MRRGLADAPWMEDELPPVGSVRVAQGASGPDATHARASPEDEAGCSQCNRATVYGNCSDPVASGLAVQFMLIAHPAQGQGCRAFVPAQPREASYVRAAGSCGDADWAFCPPLGTAELDARFPEASRIERLDPAEWLGAL